jgi:hypothetical protein
MLAVFGGCALARNLSRGAEPPRNRFRWAFAVPGASPGVLVR